MAGRMGVMTPQLDEERENRSANQMARGETNTKPRQAKRKIIKHTQGASEGAYKEIIHKSPEKIHMINQVLEDERKVDLDALPPGKRARVEELLQEESAFGDDYRCYCGFCTCGHHECPKRVVRCKYPAGLKSSYAKDFAPHPFHSTGDNFNINTLRKPPAGHCMQGTSTYKNDYPAHPVTPAAPRTGLRPSPSVPFCGGSSYANNFVNWGPNALPPVRRPAGGLYSLPFKGQSSYGSTFKPIDLASRAQRVQQPTVTVPPTKFTAVTSKMLDFQPFKVQPVQKPNTKKEPTPTFSFPGQFTTTAINEFSRRPRKERCPCEDMDIPPNFSKTTTYFNPAQKLYYV